MPTFCFRWLRKRNLNCFSLWLCGHITWLYWFPKGTKEVEKQEYSLELQVVVDCGCCCEGRSNCVTRWRNRVWSEGDTWMNDDSNLQLHWGVLHLCCHSVNINVLRGRSRKLVRGPSGVLTPGGPWAQICSKLPENCMILKKKMGERGGAWARWICWWSWWTQKTGPVSKSKQSTSHFVAMELCILCLTQTVPNNTYK